MPLNERLRSIEKIQAEHQQQLGGDRLARIENKLDALLAALAEEPIGDEPESQLDLDGNRSGQARDLSQPL